MRWLNRVRTGLREFLTTQAELAQRHDLLNRPWEEDHLHWAFDGERWQLHGHLAPPGARRRSTTGSGWCPAVPATRTKIPVA
ncbi:hypothetical protein [Amycolatopsis viridis]|uniref:Uncharacterized protein n=1 Tax=Amycolatopsis viridis TaxID=185678 RepID=A0ABX0SS87_9PSEU|nr:hypothetical protein [Amycolatopsis viridis]NIH79832.1 hypothetical protein [Amycolatopsis viridis]